MGKHYPLRFDPNIGHDIGEILGIPCACAMLGQPWIFFIQPTEQARYKTVINFNYWPVLVPYNNWNIINVTPKSIPSEAFDEIPQVVFNGISENMASLVQPGMYGSINTY